MAHTSEGRPHGIVSLYVLFIASALFVHLTSLVVGGETMGFDRNLILSVRSLATPWLTGLLLASTFTTGRLAVPALILFAAALYRRSGVRAASYYVGACIGTQILNAILKFIVHRARPHGVSPRLTAAGGLAYPSADTMLAVVIFGLGTLMLTWTIRSRSWRTGLIGAAVMFVVLAALARVYLGAHWPTDVAGGVLAGLSCAAIAVLARRTTPVLPAQAVTVPAGTVPLEL